MGGHAKKLSEMALVRGFTLWRGLVVILAALFLSPLILTSVSQPVQAQSFFSPQYKYWKKKKVYKKRRTYRKRRYKAKKKAPVNTGWAKERKSPGPVFIAVSLSDQRASVFKNGKKIASTRVSTGKAGHRTPKGVFSIIQKNRRHFSNLYNSAPMPYMQRITWSGVALHAGVIPGYPASHGCIRLPHGFARQLFGFTDMGAHVVVAQEAVSPQSISHPNLFQPNPLAAVMGHKHDKIGLRQGFSGHLRLTAGHEGQVPPTRVALADTPGTVNPAKIDIRNDKQAVATDAPHSLAPQGEKAVAPVFPFRLSETPKKPPVRILITRHTGKEQIKDVQSILNELGFDAGEADGWMGSDTWRAISAFQKSEGLEVTGRISNKLMRALYRKAGKSEVATGHIYVRHEFKDLFSASVKIKNAEKPLGTHLYTALHFDRKATTAEWVSQTISEKRQEPRLSKRKRIIEEPQFSGEPSSAEEALSRIDIPAPIRWRISELITPGASVTITDHGISNETGRGTDFVVLTK